MLIHPDGIDRPPAALDVRLERLAEIDHRAKSRLGAVRGISALIGESGGAIAVCPARG